MPTGTKPRDPSERFWAKVDRRGDSECWLWLGAMSKGRSPGYGAFQAGTRLKPRLMRAHRFAYEDLVGLIPLGLELDHLCRNPSCVNLFT